MTLTPVSDDQTRVESVELAPNADEAKRRKARVMVPVGGVLTAWAIATISLGNPIMLLVGLLGIALLVAGIVLR